MDVFGDVTQKANEVFSTVSDTLKDTVEDVKISWAIANEQKEIDKNCLAIGQWYSSEYDGEFPEGVIDLVRAVQTGKAKVAELEALKANRAAKNESEAASERGAVKKACPICGKVSDSRFCPHCGAPIGE